MENRLKLRAFLIAYVALLVAFAIYFVSGGGLLLLANWFRSEIFAPLGL